MDINKTITILDSIAPAVEAIPIAGPSLVVMLNVAKQVCQAVDGARMNRKAYEQLAQEVVRYASAVSKAMQSDPRFLPGLDHAVDHERTNLLEAVDELIIVFREVLELIEDQRKEEKKRRRKVLGRLRQRLYEAWNKEDDAENVKTISRKVESSVKAFNIGNDIRGLDDLARIKHEIKAIASAHPDLLRQELAPVLSARFDWHGMPEGCLPDTRIDLLHQIRTWVLDESPSSPDLFALTGLAGTGKTTVAQSVCIEFDRKRTTVSFFVSRSFAERRDPENIVRTIAYQLAAQHSTIRTVVFGALRNGRDVLTRPLAEQVESLIVDPLRALADSTSRILIVIDALDECVKVGHREGGELIPLLASGIRQLSRRVKLLITSREEPKIMEMVRDLGSDTRENLFRLQNIESAFVKRDVKAYFTHHFRLISKSCGLKDVGAWPSEDSLDLLVELTGKLFVFAALLVRIMSSARINPKKRLEEILRPLSSATGSGFQLLDELYLDVLNKASTSFEDPTNQQVLERVRNTVGTLVLLQSPLSADALSGILEEEAFLVWGDIEHLSAVLVVPDTPHEFVTIFHPSFRDYILTRCTVRHFRIDPADYNVFLTRRCLDVMNRHLKKDVFNIKDPAIMNEDIEDLNERRNLLITLELRYASEYWMIHLSGASRSDEGLTKDLTTFCHLHLLHWIEALSLLGRLSAAAVHLSAAITWCKRHLTATSSNIISLLDDVERLVMAYDVPIRASALQVYCSALIFMPRCELYCAMKQDIIGTVQLVSERPSTWPALRRIIEGHSGSVFSVTFSPDGKRIASASDDKTVRVWDVVSGCELAQLNGHTERVWSVAFSPDGTKIVSGSADKTVRVWDIISRRRLAQFNGHTSYVASVTFSPNGTHIASGAGDNIVRVWDAVNGCELVEFHKHTRAVRSVVFSPDGTRVASGSEDQTVRVWDVISGCELAQLNGHSQIVRSVAFSSDGKHIASGSYDKTIRVWDAMSGREIAQLSGHTEAVWSVSFSPDGTRVTSGSSDKTVRIWDVVGGRELALLRGHAEMVWSIAFSPDGTRIASGSDDKTIGVWDAVITSEETTQFNGHNGKVLSVAISPSGTLIASGSEDTTVWVWDAISGHKLAQLKGHIEAVSCVAFSPDGTRIVSGSRDKTVRVWDAISGRQLAQFNDHTDSVWSVEFTAHGTQIVSKSIFGESQVWYEGTDFPTSDPHLHSTPSTSSSILLHTKISFDSESGWLTSVQSAGQDAKRLCWIPPERRGKFEAFNDGIILGSDLGIVTMLTLSCLK